MAVFKKDIYLRMIEYGRNYPDGFSPNKIKEYFSGKPKESQLVDKLLVVAFQNSKSPINQNTPFVLLNDNGTNYLNGLYGLSYEANFNWLDYEELQQARLNAKEAHRHSQIAIIIAIISMLFSVGFSIWQIYNSVSLDEEQYRQLIETIDVNK